jgi:hypothetical protein
VGTDTSAQPLIVLFCFGFFFFFRIQDCSLYNLSGYFFTPTKAKYQVLLQQKEHCNDLRTTEHELKHGNSRFIKVLKSVGASWSCAVLSRREYGPYTRDFAIE